MFHWNSFFLQFRHKLSEMQKGRNIILTGGLLVLLMVSTSWGFLVHRTVNQLAIYEMPGSLRPFFIQNMEYMVRNAPRPDQRRNQDSTEATKHFIDLEMYGDSAAWKMPMKWEDAVRQYSKDTLLKYGYLPYLIIKVKDSLTNAFKSGIKDSILFYAADLGHYIGDAHVPLHTTVNYDGQLSNQRGLHSLWESMIPEIEISEYNLSSKHKAKYLDHPEDEIWRSIREAYLLLPAVFNEEKEASKKFVDTTKFRIQVRRGREVKSYTSEFAKAYNERLGSSINLQLTKSADMLADFLYTSWVDAGKPDLNINFSKNEKKEAKKQVKAFKRNELLRDSLLISRKIVDAGFGGQ
jgi:hypothetical protein